VFSCSFPPLNCNEHVLKLVHANVGPWWEAQAAPEIVVDVFELGLERRRDQWRRRVLPDGRDFGWRSYFAEMLGVPHLTRAPDLNCGEVVSELMDFG